MAGPRERTSAGGVVVRTDVGVQVCLIRPTGRTVWGLPKGGLESGETLTQAAVREVAEETGISGVVAAELGAIDYSFYSREQNSRIHKTVHYYLMHATGGDTADHDHEVNEARWVEIYTAVNLLTFDSERQILHLAIEHIRALKELV